MWCSIRLVLGAAWCKHFETFVKRGKHRASKEFGSRQHFVAS